MMFYLPGIFCFIVLAAGWYYLFYSPAAGRLATIEGQARNALRIRLRRANAVIMMLLAVAIYALVYTLRPDDRENFLWIMVCIIFMLAAMMVLALIDVHLTRKLRKERRKNTP